MASAVLISVCEIPNCRAIAEGLTPALKAARTAFSLPVVNEPVPSVVGFSFARPDGHPTAALGLGDDSHKQSIDFGIIQPLQRSG